VWADGVPTKEVPQADENGKYNSIVILTSTYRKSMGRSIGREEKNAGRLDERMGGICLK